VAYLATVLARSLYIHVPFCARRCVYCDFSIAVRSRIPVDEYLRAIEREWERHRDSTFDLDTVYLGGGTPSKLGASGITRLLDAVRRHARVRDDAEVTLEANPEDVTAETIRAWRSAGVNRLSLGVQSFDDRVLAWMHRTHDAEKARTALDVARQEGIGNLSIDLIFAVPDALERSWARDLDAALALEPPHISVYGLTIEERTPLGRWVADTRVAEAPEDVFAADFLRARQALTSAGLEHYEVSNYGRPGYHSRHNWAYWCRKPYGGIGPSAHEFSGTARRWNAEPYVEWLAKTSRGEDPLSGCEELTSEQAKAEEVYLNLRTAAGLSLSPAEREHVQPWIESGWAVVDGTKLRLTGDGWLRLDALANDLTLFRSRY